MLHKASFSDICQMRLDFDNFDITETTAGVCTDSLTVTGPTGRNPMDLCGTLTGMHRKSHNLPPAPSDKKSDP